MNIFLVGFMGSGKSTIARILHEEHGMEILEMDEYIQKQEKRSIEDIFREQGEEYFRNLETEFLRKVNVQENYVVSCGGGVVLRDENIQIMKKNGIVVWLEARPETILGRVKDNDDRPLLHGNKNVTFIAEMMNKRKERYEKAADIVVNTDDKTSAEISEEILKKIR